MRYLNNPILTLLTLAAFIWLAWYSQQTGDLGAFTEQKLSAYQAEKASAQIVYLYGEE